MSTKEDIREAATALKGYAPEVSGFLGGNRDPETLTELHRKIRAIEEVLSMVKTGDFGFDNIVRELRKVDTAYDDVPTFRAERGTAKDKVKVNPLAELLD